MQGLARKNYHNPGIKNTVTVTNAGANPPVYSDLLNTGSNYAGRAFIQQSTVSPGGAWTHEPAIRITIDGGTPYVVALASFGIFTTGGFDYSTSIRVEIRGGFAVGSAKAITATAYYSQENSFSF